MALHLIIDGYNVIGAKGRAQHAGWSSEETRERLVQALSLYRQRKGHPITVVFDGWQQGAGTERHEHRAGVQVVYSKRGERADQVIQRLARQYGRDCAVVSSDREVANVAKAHGAFVIGAVEFDAKLYEQPAGIRRGGVFHKDSTEDDQPRRNADKKGNPRKLPKALRTRNRQLKRF